MKLHIGCFNVVLEGWYNTDISIHLFIARVPLCATLLHTAGLMTDQSYGYHREGLFRRVHYLNAARRFPMADDSIEAIYTSHLVGNFTRGVALSCMKECHRVLKRGGVLRVATPDLDAWVREYDPMNPDRFLNLFYLPGVRGHKNLVKWVYNAHSLRALLKEAGFAEVTRCRMRKGRCPDVDRIDYREDSFFLEAVK